MVTVKPAVPAIAVVALPAEAAAPTPASMLANRAAAILAMNDGFLPPTINYSETDPECDLDYIPNRSICRDVDVALCNCIGFGSKNSALVIARGEPT